MRLFRLAACLMMLQGSGAAGRRSPIVHSIHLTAWCAADPAYRSYAETLLSNSSLNSVTIDVKETEGTVYIPGVPDAKRAGTENPILKDLPAWLSALKRRGVYTVARIVCFKDNRYPRLFPGHALVTKSGNLWEDDDHFVWLNPFDEAAWEYDLNVAFQAARMGFDEIQLDYVRFPDFPAPEIRWETKRTEDTMSRALTRFLKTARRRLKPYGVALSVDVFDRTVWDSSGQYIGQRLKPMAEQVDFICPMLYPSLLVRGEYGFENPAQWPYETSSQALEDALHTLGSEGKTKLRPYLQNFSLHGVTYGEKEVRAQIRASSEAGVENWTLWNPQCHYSEEAIRP